ncbi:MAG: hypothetical protein ACT4QG_07250 [Sporichthyaceae bacterium]
MNPRSQAACALAGLIGAGLVLTGLIVADFLPPPKASWTPEQFAEFYREEADRIRVGILILFAGTWGWAALVAVAFVQLWRNRAGRTMAALHAVGGAAVYLLLVLYCTILAAAAFRADRAPEDVQLLHDVGWFMAFLAAPPFVVQALAVGLGALTGGSPYPRWLGYLGLWVAILLTPGTILLFFHTGPFAYHGLISYWIPVFAFGSWMLGTSFCALMVARADEKTPAP